MIQVKISYVLISFYLLVFSVFACAGEQPENFNWTGLQKEKISLEKPLLIIKGSKGFLACAYIDIKACNSTGAACAIVSGVNTHEDMLKAKVLFVSDKAQELGIKNGMNGAQVIQRIR